LGLGPGATIPKIEINIENGKENRAQRNNWQRGHLGGWGRVTSRKQENKKEGRGGRDMRKP